MWSITRRLTQSWTRCSLWKRSLLLFVGLCFAIQLAFVASLWRESCFRRRIQANGSIVLGHSMLPDRLVTELRGWIGHGQTKLFSPIVELIINDPTASDLAYVASLNSLKALELRGGARDAIRLKQLGSLRQLTTLCLRDLELDSQSLSGLANCPKLCRIRVHGNVVPEALEPLKHCESLRDLYLEGSGNLETSSRESPFTGSHLAAIAKIPHLKHLMIKAGEIDDTELADLAFARELETLTVYSLRLHEDAINALGGLPRLQQLVIETIETNNLDRFHPRPLEGFPALKAFSTTGSRITPAFIAGLAKLPKLEALSFQRCWVNENIAALGELPKLKMLDLARTDVLSTDFRIIGHLNAGPHQLMFISELSHPSPNRNDVPTIRREDYFNQPEWPEVGEQYPNCIF